MNVVEPVMLAERKPELNVNVVEALPPPPPPPPPMEEEEEEEMYEADVVEVKAVVVNGVQIEEAYEDDDVANDDWMISDSNSPLPQEIVSLPTETEVDSHSPVKQNQKPQVSSRFGHRKPINTSTEGK